MYRFRSAAALAGTNPGGKVVLLAPQCLEACVPFEVESARRNSFLDGASGLGPVTAVGKTACLCQLLDFSECVADGLVRIEERERP